MSTSEGATQGSARRRPLKTISEAREMIRSELRGEQTPYHLLPSDEFQRTQGKFRSTVYNHFNFLCYKGTMACTGWLLCSRALNGACTLNVAVRPYDKKLGTSSLSKHIESHTKEGSNEIVGAPVKASMPQKKSLYRRRSCVVARTFAIQLC